MNYSSAKATPSAQKLGSVPLILAALVGQNAAQIGLTNPLVSPGYSVFLVIISIVGAFISLTLRKRLTSRVHLLPGSIGLIAFFFVVQFIVVRFGRSLPIDFVLTSADMSLIFALTLTSAMATLIWLSDGATLFSCVWSMAMIGLAATLNLNPLTIICFGVYLFCALFLMIHQHTLSQASAEAHIRATRMPLLAVQLRSAIFIWLVTLGLGILVAVPLQMIGRNLSLAAILEKLKVNDPARKPTTPKPRLLFDRSNSFAVGLGPVTDSDALVFQVTTSQTHYWRMRTFATCLGTEWTPYENDLEGQVLSPQITTGNRNRFVFSPALEGERKNITRVKASVEPRAATRGLIHLAEPRVLTSDQPSIVRRVDGTFATRNNLLDFAAPPGHYELEADVSSATPNELNKTSINYSREIMDRYLQEQEPGLLDQLAREALGSARRPYDKAEAIRKFVANRCLYSLDAPACPPGRNPAEWFLNESKVGYCDLFATAMTLLCRAARIPARIATGFNAGETDPDQANSYLLRERNRHAWCEVYFNNYGWIPFDATVLTVEATMPPVASAPKTRNTTTELPMGPRVLLGLAFVGFFIVGAREFLVRRGVLPTRSVLSVEELCARHLLTTYRSALKILKHNGASRPSSMTVGEHIEQVRSQLGSSVGSAYILLARLSERALFAQQPILQSDVVAAQEALRTLKLALKERKH